MNMNININFVDDNNKINIVFLANKDNHKFTNNDVLSEYIVNYWNGKIYGNIALSLNILKSINTSLTKKKNKKYIFFTLSFN